MKTPHKDIYEEIDHHKRLLESYAFCALATGQYVEAGVIENASALLTRLSIILRTLETVEKGNTQ